MGQISLLGRVAAIAREARRRRRNFGAPITNRITWRATSALPGRTADRLFGCKVELTLTREVAVQSQANDWSRESNSQLAS